MSRPELYVHLVVGPDCDFESMAIRAALESFGASVTLDLIGRPNDLIDILSGNDLPHKMDYLLLNFHGDEGRFCLPELGEEVYEENEPRSIYFEPQHVLTYCQLQGVKVIAAGCTLGWQQLATAFLESGCHSYLAPDDYIEGNANLMFLIHFFYEIITNHRSQQEAFELAQATDLETALYKLYLAEKRS